MDFSLYQLINGYAYHHDLVEDPLRFCALYAEYLFMALLAGLFLVRGKWRTSGGGAASWPPASARRSRWRRPQVDLAPAGAPATLLGPSGRVLSSETGLPRLVVPERITATAAFAIAVAILLRHRKARPAGPGDSGDGRPSAAWPSASHYPADVAAGALLGHARRR